jgi:hypothetical protein
MKEQESKISLWAEVITADRPDSAYRSRSFNILYVNGVNDGSAEREAREWLASVYTDSKCIKRIVRIEVLP